MYIYVEKNCRFMEKMKEKIGENLWQADKMILQKLFQPIS